MAKRKKPFSNEEKVAFVLLLTIGFLGVVFGFKSFGANLSRPFQVQLAAYTGESFMTITEKEAAEVERQKTTDTDADGLLDYDELYIYKTSPYLTDSDSDGLDDKTEIFSNQDPNCPVGKDCYASVATANSPEEAADSSSGNSALISNLLGISNTDTSGADFQSTDDINNIFSSLDVGEIRTILISQGIPKETVDAMSDQEILDLLDQALSQATELEQTESLLPESDASNQ
ncbi:MAG: Ig domain-containing protein [Candidatus Uhrbacteria bacterium GW2011_GWE2_45_35]|uniref:Ig domain-containing protein n=2 Tax=Candidatus Uhriibacteriota TaxID=1752732 RepID=A0A0G1MI97_9BACT|nr:MAG: Ig domain-containing protein [Candidatus Uhrbacteria bacterium GW2011_GWF2_44_350]KKU08445.1 MAG: Ig domain-containing protein [Candidatus Uhrbacteria bacterium GW2011_GWE2_45_35]